MNVFYLDEDPGQAAVWHVDSHVIKMPLEYAQLLSTAHVQCDGKQVGYKATHVNHPSAQWARSNVSAYEWLFELFACTSNEYRFRYGRQHQSWFDLSEKLAKPPRNMGDNGFFLPPLAMPAEYLVPRTERPGVLCVESYRRYYNEGKRHLHAWSRRDPPPWITEPT